MYSRLHDAACTTVFSPSSLHSPPPLILLRAPSILSSVRIIRVCSHVLLLVATHDRHFYRFVLAVLSQEVRRNKAEPDSKGGRGEGNPYCFSCPINPTSRFAFPPLVLLYFPLSLSFSLCLLLSLSPSHFGYRQHTPTQPQPATTPAILNPLAMLFSAAGFVNLGPAVLYGTHVLPERIQAILSPIPRGCVPPSIVANRSR